VDPNTPAVEIVTIDTPSLGDRSYLMHDGTYAIVVDPQRDTDRITDVIATHGLTVTHVLETHIHNDYVTGGFALARQLGAEYAVNADDPVSYQRLPVRDGDVLHAGSRMKVRVLHTPGHTFTHLSYALEVDGRTCAVFTGGSLLYGSTGRPDLLGAQHAATLARHQHASAHRLVAELPSDTPVYPTHGFGSFCAATQSEAATSTLAAEARTNPALTQAAEEFVAGLLAGLDAYPAYYAHMGPANAAGPAAVDLTPPRPANPAELRRRIDAGVWVVDLRTRTAFAAGHLPGTLNFALHDSFVTYLGWLIPWGTPVTLLGETAADVAAAQRDMARIGIDRPAAAATGKPEDWAGGGTLGSFPTATFEDLAAVLNAHHDHPDNHAHHDRPVVLDVRRNDERRMSHVDGTVHIPIHELPTRLADVSTDRQIWVHCAAGYRASIAASLLHRAGRDVVAVDDAYDNAHLAGLPIAVPAA
jgi:glyoxylase-like metal-dependent hydrolase (beta-lactamase superfamily II)/rhodanese-related sulfurtransferase